MKKKMKARCLASCLAAVTLIGSAGIPVAAQETGEADAAQTDAFVPEAKADKGNFNTGWKFNLGDVENADQKEFDDSGWEDIQIPHDFSMDQEFSAQYEAESGFLPGGTGWYRKSVVFPEDYEGKTLTINFDGVYNHAYVYVNGTKIGENFYGYNDFSLDITDYVTCDGKTENVISVKAVNEFPSSRWYSGSGIYRDVTMTVSGDIHVADEGTYVTTPNLEAEQDGDVTVHVETDVKNERAESGTVTVRTTILNDQGDIVSKEAGEKEVTVGAEEEVTAEQDVVVNKPELWDCDNPNLYYVQTEILEEGEVIDSYETEFGFRYLEYDADFGFKLNGENVKMKGVCMHHDQGALGAASYYDAVKRQVEILKGMGVNAIRASHNVPSDMLISICNEEGILVMNEIFDGWTEYKNGNYNDFGKEFNKTLAADNQVIGGSSDKTWAQFALESTVNRDKNDPCVVMWSIGNELPTGCTGEGASNAQATYPDIAADLIKWIQDIDATKPITMGDNQPTWNSGDFRTNIDNQLAAADGVVGLNYYPTQYESKHNQQPTWPLVGTETASPANSRGIYNTLSSSSQLGDYQCTAYDTACVGWGNTARESWYYTIKNDFIMGEFIWTGFDYIGEPTGTGAWNGTGSGSVVGGDQAVPNSSFFGVIDTAGFPKDSYYFYSSQWVEDKTTLHVVPQSWNEEDLTISSGKVPVYIYSNAAKVELYLNDVKIGTATRNDFETDAGYTYSTYTNTSDNAELCTAVNENQEWKRMAAQFSVQYEEGTLSAKAYDSNGELIEDTYGLDYVTTNSDEGSSLKVTAEKSEIQADGSSLSYISVDVLDGNGEFVSSARNNIRFSLTGNGEIVGVDNGNPSTTDKFQQPTVLTGETGAGKSIILGALSLVLGQRADGKSIQQGADKCVIEAVFDISKYQLEPFFLEKDLEYDAACCILRRELYASGKSRAFVNASPVSLSILKELGTRLIDIHSQHQNLLLGDTHFQLRVVDVMAENQILLILYKKEYSRYQGLRKELKALEQKAAQTKQEEDYIRFQLDQLLEASLKEGEQEELEQEQETLSHAEEIKGSLYKVSQLLEGEEMGAVQLLKEALSTAEGLESYFPKAKEMAERLRSAYIDLDDLASEADSLKEDVEYNPETGERKDSFVTAVALSRKVNGKTQKILLSGDADMLSNRSKSWLPPAYGNRTFIDGITYWFTDGEYPLDMRTPQATDDVFNYFESTVKALKVGFVYVLPGLLAVSFLILWFRRRAR